MKIQVKQPRCINGVDYAKGTHEVPDALEGHWFFQACLVNGSVSILEKGGAPVAQPEPVKAPEAPAKPAENYHEHMAKWESKADQKGAAPEVSTQAEAQAMVDSGEAEIPAEAVLDIKSLRKQAKELGLKANGNAAEIAERIEKHLAKKGG